MVWVPWTRCIMPVLFIVISITLGNHKGLPLQCRHRTVTVLYPLTTRDNHLKNLMAMGYGARALIYKFFWLKLKFM